MANQSTEENDFAKRAREVKAQRLAALFYDRARDVCFKADERRAVKPRPAEQCAGDIMEMARHAGPAHWLSLTREHNDWARTHGASVINTPSMSTMALATDIVIERAKEAAARSRRATR